MAPSGAKNAKFLQKLYRVFWSFSLFWNLSASWRHFWTLFGPTRLKLSGTLHEIVPRSQRTHTVNLININFIRQIWLIKHQKYILIPSSTNVLRIDRYQSVLYGVGAAHRRPRDQRAAPIFNKNLIQRQITGWFAPVNIYIRYTIISNIWGAPKGTAMAVRRG